MPKFLNDIKLEQANDIQFKTTAGANAGKIEQDGNNLVLSNAVGDVLLGDGASDIFIGDGTNNVDVIFEQSGSIKGDGSAVTLTIGGSNTTLNLENPNINGSLSISATTINNKLTFTTANGFILFDYEPSGDTGEYTTEVPLLKVGIGTGETTILSRISEYRGVALGADDTVWLRAGDTGSTIKANVNLSAEQVLMSAEGGFHAYGFPSNDTSWANRVEFKFRTDSGTASDNGLYIGDGGYTQFIDLSRNLLNIGTISSGAITSTAVTITNQNPSLNFTDASGSTYTAQWRFKDNDLQYLWGGGIKAYFTTAGIGLGDNGTTADARIERTGSSPYGLTFKTNNTSALSLDASQNATFAGDLTVGTAQQHHESRYTSPKYQVSFDRTSSSDQYFKIITNTGAAKRVKLSIGSGGDNTNTQDQYLISQSGYSFQTHIFRLPGSKYNTSKLVSVICTNSTGSTQEVWIKLLGMTSDTGTTIVSANVPISTSSAILATATTTKPTLASGDSELDISVSDRNDFTTMSSGGAKFGGDVVLSATKKLYLDGGSNSYIHESAGDTIDIVRGGTTSLTVSSAGISSANNVYSGTSSSFRNYSGTWQASTGLTGNGFTFVNSVDGTALTLSSTGNAVFAGTGQFNGSGYGLTLFNGTNGTTSKLLFKNTDNNDTSKFIRGSAYYLEFGSNQNEGFKFTDVQNSTTLLQINGGNNSSGNGVNSATFAGQVDAKTLTIDGSSLGSYHDFQSKPIDSDSGLFTVGGHGEAGGYSRAVSIFTSHDGVWNSWVGTNLRWDGTNFKRASDAGNNNWGNIAGIRFLGNSATSGAAMQFIIDPPEQSNAPSGEQTIGTSLPSSMTALSINNDLSVTFAGNIVMAANATVDGRDISSIPTTFAPTNAQANVAPTTAQVKTALNANLGTVTVGDADDDINIQGNLTVTGITTMSGGTVINTTTNTAIKDTTIFLNSGQSSSTANVADIGLILDRGSTGNVFMGWDESEDEFIFAKTSSEGDFDAGAAVGGGTPGIVIDNEETDFLHVKVGTLESVGAITSGGSAILTAGTAASSFPSGLQNSNVTSVSGSSGSCTGNAATATAFSTTLGLTTVSMTFQLAANTWTDTGIDGTDLATGTYAMQVYVDDHNAGGLHFDEYYSATISWYGGSTNSTNHNEIVLHGAGHANNNSHLQIRTLRASNSDTHDLMLQVKQNFAHNTALNGVDGKTMIFKFRRLI